MTFLLGDATETLRTLPDESVNCCVTSPPYYALRDYGKEGQIGLEETPEKYIERLVEVFREVKRVLKKDGTLWLNIGDSYYHTTSNNGGFSAKSTLMGTADTAKGRIANNSGVRKKLTIEDAKPKDLLGIPWMLAFALRRDGWYLRQDIIWQKPNCMPESVTDRCTKSHEYIFLLAKSERYYFDHKAIRELADPKYEARYKSAFNKGKVQEIKRPPCIKAKQTEGMKKFTGFRSKRSVWCVPVSSIKEKHFAPYPKKLIEPCILAGCPEGGTVLDPFLGSGTTGIVAELNGRNCIGIELNEEFLEIAKRRIAEETKGGKQLPIDF